MRKFLRDTWLVFTRQLQLQVRQPVWVVVGLLQPLFFLLLFAPLLEGMMKQAGGTRAEAYQWFIPGLLVQMAMFGTLFAGFGIIAELRAGVIERMRVTPVSRVALLFGRTGRDIVTLFVQCLLLVVLAIPFGLEVSGGPLLLMFGMIALIGVLCASVSYGLGLLTRSEDALAPIMNTFSFPLLLTAGILLPLSNAPGWLQAIGDVNPFTWAADASRELFQGHWDATVVWQALAILGGLAVLGVVWGAREFSRSVR
jgi:ABC-2 type transport system permease protein